MSESLKRNLLIALIVVGVVAAGYEGKQFVTSDQPHVIKRIEGDPSKSMKRLEMESQRSGAPVGDTVANGAPVAGQASRDDRDLGDSLVGNR